MHKMGLNIQPWFLYPENSSFFSLEEATQTVAVTASGTQRSPSKGE